MWYVLCDRGCAHCCCSFSLPTLLITYGLRRPVRKSSSCHHHHRHRRHSRMHSHHCKCPPLACLLLVPLLYSRTYNFLASPCGYPCVSDKPHSSEEYTSRQLLRAGRSLTG